MAFCALLALSSITLLAAEHQGIVRFNGLPVPGATVIATQGTGTSATITDAQGAYKFTGLVDGPLQVTVRMTGFAEQQREVTARQEAPPLEWALKMLPLEAMNAQAQVAAPPSPPPAPLREDPVLTQQAADGFLINGTANNGAASPFGQAPAFGNNRRGNAPLYTGNIGGIFDNAITDARPYSLTGQPVARPDYNRVQAVAAFSGPLRIPRLLRRNGPTLTVNYQWLRYRTVTTQSGLMPTEAERAGDLSQSPKTVIDPATGAPFPGNRIPLDRISPQAKELLKLYPLPNFTASNRYNYQIPISSGLHQDNLQSRFQQRFPYRNQLSGNFAWYSSRADNPNLFDFLDLSNSSGINAGINWMHMFNQRLYTLTGVQYSRSSARVTPFFADRLNISGLAGINGNNQDPVNWGPPSLSFAGGIAALSGAQASLARNQSVGITSDTGISRGRHNLTVGGAYRRQQFNLLTQEDPRGTMAFTGAAAGSDFGGFLLGIPDTSSIAFGNADKYLRGTSASAYIADDMRVRAGLSLNFGLRWEYESPVTELYGRLVNLSVGPSFTSASPILGTNSPLLHPDRNNWAPRAGFAWRPMAASSMVVRGGYGIYYDTAIYAALATLMSQQSPFSTTLRAENRAATPLTLANAFDPSHAITGNTFAVDSAFRVGYSQNWQLSIQRDLPASLVMTATYLGLKGTRAQQQFLPNTYPAGSSLACTGCPTGFTFLVSNGNSTRHAAQLEIRRRLHSGLAASLAYTFSKSIDNAALGGQNQGGALIAQNWLDLQAERALSIFDQRHLLKAEAQYTTGMGLGGGTLMSGWKASLLHDWTFSTQITAGTGLPLTPIYFAAVQGTGVTGSIRPDYTGVPLYSAPPGRFLNPDAYTAPRIGTWGNAGRNSITGPSQFTLNSSLSRTFRLADRLSLDFRVDALNALNHPVFPSWNTVVTSEQFGLRNPANAMRTIQTVARFRF